MRHHISLEYLFWGGGYGKKKKAPPTFASNKADALSFLQD